MSARDLAEVLIPVLVYAVFVLAVVYVRDRRSQPDQPAAEPAPEDLPAAA